MRGALSDSERFERKVDRSSGAAACHPFTAFRHHGYGRAWFRGRKEWAHRVAWMLAFGDIPHDREVAHRCDNRACCNPAHLWLASHAENMADMRAKGRHKHGERGSKVSEAVAREIRALRAEGVPLKAVAARAGVSQAQASRIANGQRWAHLTPAS